MADGGRAANGHKYVLEVGQRLDEIHKSFVKVLFRDNVGVSVAFCVRVSCYRRRLIYEASCSGASAVVERTNGCGRRATTAK